METLLASAYGVDMPKQSYPGQPNDPWRAALGRSKTQIASGEGGIALLPVLDRLRSAAESLEADQGVTADGERVTACR